MQYVRPKKEVTVKSHLFSMMHYSSVFDKRAPGHRGRSTDRQQVKVPTLQARAVGAAHLAADSADSTCFGVLSMDLRRHYP